MAWYNLTGYSILMTHDGSPTSAETDFLAEMASAGASTATHSITDEASTDALPAAMTGYDLLILGQTINTYFDATLVSAVLAKGIPILSLTNFLSANFALGSGLSTNSGTTVDIVTSSHYLAAGFSGSGVSFLTVAKSYYVNTSVGPGAVVIATPPSTPSQYFIYGYEKNAQRVGLVTNPLRFAQIGLRTAPALTGEGNGVLFEQAAVHWLLEIDLQSIELPVQTLQPGQISNLTLRKQVAIAPSGLAPTVGAVALTQQTALTPVSLAPTATAVALKQDVALPVQTLKPGQFSNLTLRKQVAVASPGLAPTMSAVALTQQAVLDPLSLTPTVGGVALTQDTELVPNSLQPGAFSSLTLRKQVEVPPVALAPDLTALALTAAVVTDPLSLTPTLTALGLTQQAELDVVSIKPFFSEMTITLGFPPKNLSKYSRVRQPSSLLGHTEVVVNGSSS